MENLTLTGIRCSDPPASRKSPYQLCSSGGLVLIGLIVCIANYV
jgi:hypothetical protein